MSRKSSAIFGHQLDARRRQTVASPVEAATLLGALLPRNPKVAIAAASLGVALSTLGTAGPAMAGNMDITPERLADCSMSPCLPNNVGWANLMSELGMAIAPTAFHAARTTGLGGFALSLEASFTHMNVDASAGGQQYWHLGTAGPVDPNTHAFSVENTNPDSLLGVYSSRPARASPTGSRSQATSGTSPTRRCGSAGPTCAGRSSRATARACSDTFRTSPSAAACARSEDRRSSS